MKGIRYFVLSIMIGIIFLGGAFASSIVLPSNIVATVPITITGTTIPTNSQVMVNFPANSFSTYEAQNLQNIEFFYSNGTIIPQPQPFAPLLTEMIVLTGVLITIVLNV